MKFKVGDRVKVRKDLKNNAFYGENRVNEEMFMHRGQILTIRAIDGKNYLMEEDNWYWNDEMFENKDYTYEDLKKSPIGTKITFENGSTLTKTKRNFYTNEFWDVGDEAFKDNYGGCYLGKITKIEEPTYSTVYEYKPEILDEVEKRYLGNFIRPFKDSVETIRRLYSPTKEKDYIQVRYKDDRPTNLPYFESDTMYKKMEINKNYTLEELGL